MSLQSHWKINVLNFTRSYLADPCAAHIPTGVNTEAEWDSTSHTDAQIGRHQSRVWDVRSECPDDDDYMMLVTAVDSKLAFDDLGIALLSWDQLKTDKHSASSTSIRLSGIARFDCVKKYDFAVSN